MPNETINLSEVIKKHKQYTTSKENIAATNKFAGEDIIVVIGDTGVGKSTLMHILAGSRIDVTKADTVNITAQSLDAKNPNAKRNSTQWPAAVDEFVISSKTASATKDVRGLNLADPSLWVKYDLKKSLYVIDTPGFGDTNKTDSVLNILKIVDAARKAKSVRFLVLFSAKAFQERGVTLRRVLDCVAKLTQDAEKNAKSIYYGFSKLGAPDFANDVKTQINDLIESKEAAVKNGEESTEVVSDSVYALLKDMKKKVSGGITQINPAPPVPTVLGVKLNFMAEKTIPTISPEDLVKNILALDPITNPEQEISFFIEPDIREQLKNQLTTIFTSFTTEMNSLKECVDKNLNLEIVEDANKLHDHAFSILQAMDHIVFVHQYLTVCDPLNYFEQSKETILNLAKTLLALAQDIFNTKNLEKPLDENDVRKHLVIKTVLAHLETLWLSFFGDAPEELSQKALQDVVNSYQAALVDKLEKFQTYQSLQFEAGFLARIDDIFVKINRDISRLKKKTFPATKLVREDVLKTDIQVIKDYLALDTNEWYQLTRVKVPNGLMRQTVNTIAQEGLQRTLGFSNDFSFLQNNLFNLNFVQTQFNAPATELVTHYLPILLFNLESKYVLALSGHDFKTAILFLDKMHNIVEMMATAEAKDKFADAKKRFFYTIFEFLQKEERDKVLGQDLDEAKTRKLIYQVLTISLLEKDALAEKHLEYCIVAADKNPVSLDPVCQQLYADLDEVYSQHVKAIEAIISKEKDIAGISALNLPLQQLWYVLSIVEVLEGDHVQRYQQLEEKIKRFITGFRIRFGEMLDKPLSEKVNYEAIAEYIDLLEKQPWIDEMQLEAETIVKLLETVCARIQKIVERATTLELGSAAHDNLEECKRLLIEINIIQVQLGGVIPHEYAQRLREDAEDFLLEEVEDSLDEIESTCQDKEKFKNLSIDDIVNLNLYIIKCKGQAFSTDITKIAQECDGLFIDALQILLREQVATVSNFLATLASWQSVSSHYVPSADEVTALVEHISQAIEKIKNLQEKFKQNASVIFSDNDLGYYGVVNLEYAEKCRIAYQECQNLLAHNLQAFSQEMEKALNERFENLEEVTSSTENEKITVGQRLILCKQLTSFDTFLPEPVVADDADTKEKKKTYERLYNKYEKALQANFVLVFTNALNQVRLGQYLEAIITAGALHSSKKLQTLLSTQVSATVQKMYINEVVRLSAQLSLSKVARPGFINDYILKLKRLEGALVLTETAPLQSFLNEETVEKREKALKTADEAIYIWFQNCLAELRRHIGKFEVQNYTAMMTTLKNIIEEMSIKPKDWENEVRKVAGEFATKLQQVTFSYSNPIPTWVDHKYTINDVYQQLVGSAPASTPETQYKSDWKIISDAVFQRVADRCDDLEREINSNSKNTVEIIETIATIEQHVGTLPVYGEETELRKRVVELCKTSVQTLLTKITFLAINKNFDAFLEMLRQLWDNKRKLKYSRDGLDFTTVLTPLHEKSKALREEIIDSLNKDQFPRDVFAEFIKLYSVTSDLSNEVCNDFALCKDALRKFVKQLFSQIKSNILFAQTSGKVNLEVLKDAFAQLTEINSCQKDLSDNKLRQLFVNMLPDDFDAAMDNIAFQSTLDLFKTKQEAFVTALREQNPKQLHASLKFIQEWEDVISSMTSCISQSLSPSKVLENFTHFLAAYNLAHLIEMIQKELDSLQTRLTFTTKRYLDLAEKSESLRKEYFNDLLINLKFISSCKPLQDYLDVAKSESQLVEATTTYLKQLFELAIGEMADDFEAKNNWERFNDCYKELSAFAESSKGNVHYPRLGTITFIPDMPNNAGWFSYFFKSSAPVQATESTKDLARRFTDMLDQKMESVKEDLDVLIKQDKDDEICNKIVAFAISMQIIINSLSYLSEHAFKLLGQFFEFILNRRSPQYLQFLAMELQKDSSGIGASIVQQQSCFSGASIQMRNLAMQAQGIDYVLDNLMKRTETGEIVSISNIEKKCLFDNYNAFQKKYEELLKANLNPGIHHYNIDKFLGHFLTELNNLIDLKNNPPALDANNKIIWPNSIKEKIPTIMAYLFAIWTLRDSKAYFDMVGVADRATFLKKPHAAQVVAVFRKLGVDAKEEILFSHLAQVFSGEGKSVVIAVTAATLTLLGFSVDCGCYSEYLSDRDFKDFQKIFEFLQVKPFITYGTFNRIFEDILNEKGDLRDLTKTLITQNTLTLAPPASDGRIKIAIGDEIDTFFQRNFFGALYNAVLRFTNPEVQTLIQAIWYNHKNNIDMTPRSVKSTPEYASCAKMMGDWAFLLDKPIFEMLEALKEYTYDKEKHDYRLYHGEIGYLDGDSIKTDIDMRYKTMWAYFAEEEKGQVARTSLQNHIGLLINCGNYSYIEMVKMGFFRCILGATGTLQELSSAETQAIEKEFSISKMSYIPSVYGKNKLDFKENAGVKVVSDAEYVQTLLTDIRRLRVGTSFMSKKEQTGADEQNDKAKAQDVNVRPVIVFFKSYQRLMDVFKSEDVQKAILEEKLPINLMTEFTGSTVKEQDAEILKATMPGQITFAQQEFMRGRDFICRSSTINTNGGLVVIGGFMPLSLAEQRQMQFRTARQGEPGSFVMILSESDLKNDFGVTPDHIVYWRNRDYLYAALNTVRIKKFEENYAAIVAKMDDVRENFHKPSVTYWRNIQSFNPAHGLQNSLGYLKALNFAAGTQQIIKGSNTLLLMDATGSMGPFIEGAKQTIHNLVRSLSIMLQNNEIPLDNFSIRLAIYRNYNSRTENVFQRSKATSEPQSLQSFINQIQAMDGSPYWGPEAVEVGLCYAVKKLNKNKDSITQIVLIGDQPPNPERHMNDTYIPQYGKMHQGTFYSKAGYKTADHFVRILADKKVPIHTFWVTHDDSTIAAFKDISAKTEGNSQFLNVSNPHTAAENILPAIGKTIVDSMSNDQADKERMFKEFLEIARAGSKRS